MQDPVSGFDYPVSWVERCNNPGLLESVDKGLAILTADGEVRKRGFTTGTTAAAAAKAAVLSLAGDDIREVTILTPSNIRIHIPVLKPDVVMIVDPTLIGSQSLVEGVGEDTVFVVNTEKDAAETKKALGLTGQTLHTVAANSISYRLFQREIPNSAMMGAFARACPQIISLEALIREAEGAFAHLLAKDLVAKNLDAIRCGYDEVKSA